MQRLDSGSSCPKMHMRNADFKQPATRTYQCAMRAGEHTRVTAAAPAKSHPGNETKTRGLGWIKTTRETNKTTNPQTRPRAHHGHTLTPSTVALCDFSRYRHLPATLRQPTSSPHPDIYSSRQAYTYTCIDTPAHRVTQS